MRKREKSASAHLGQYSSGTEFVGNVLECLVSNHHRYLDLEYNKITNIPQKTLDLLGKPEPQMFAYKKYNYF